MRNIVLLKRPNAITAVKWSIKIINVKKYRNIVNIVKIPSLLIRMTNMCICVDQGRTNVSFVIKISRKKIWMTMKLSVKWNRLINLILKTISWMIKIYNKSRCHPKKRKKRSVIKCKTPKLPNLSPKISNPLRNYLCKPRSPPKNNKYQYNRKNQFIFYFQEPKKFE